VQLTSARFADGEVVWFWRPDAGAKLATMLRIAPMTGATKPVPREEHEGNRKAIAQGMFWRKKALNINEVRVLCRRLCRDRRKLLICKKFPAGAADAFGAAVSVSQRRYRNNAWALGPRGADGP
jgi:hypothetical protein